jgi:quercetin dioxygenase-like cupin family protein
MSIQLIQSRAILALVMASLIAIAAAIAPAHAGECPADKVGENAMKPGAKKPKGVSDTVLSALDLGQQYSELAGRELRLRRLVIEPGGVVPWHDHADRPANIYVIEGEVTEYRSTCAVPIVHKAGEVAPEFGAISHWWKNTGDKPAVLISADLFRNGTKDDQM